MATKIVLEGDRSDVEAHVYSLCTSADPMALLAAYGYDFRVAASAVADNVGAEYIWYARILFRPDCLIQDYLVGSYEAAVKVHLKTLGVAISIRELSRGLTASVRPDRKSGGLICRLASRSQGRNYNPGLLLEKLASIPKASLTNIWTQLESCELKQ